MKDYLPYQHIVAKCDEINKKFIPNETPFIDTVDRILENDEGTPRELLLLAYQKLLKVVDEQIQKIEDQVDFSPSCFKGCAHCCYHPIIVTRMEAKLIIQWINNQPQKDRENILSHLKHYYKKNEMSISKTCTISFEDDASYKHKYIAEHLSCPFLDLETNSCKVYEVRPIPCRTYLNYGNPQVCADEFMPKEPFSYEFLGEFYLDGLNELIQAFLYEGEDELGIVYPEDVFEFDYLPNLLKKELSL